MKVQCSLCFLAGCEALEKLLLSEVGEKFDRESAREDAVRSAIEEGHTDGTERFHAYVAAFKHGRGTQFDRDKLAIAARDQKIAELEEKVANAKRLFDEISADAARALKCES